LRSINVVRPPAKFLTQLLREAVGASAKAGYHRPNPRYAGTSSLSTVRFYLSRPFLHFCDCSRHRVRAVCAPCSHRTMVAEAAVEADTEGAAAAAAEVSHDPSKTDLQAEGLIVRLIAGGYGYGRGGGGYGQGYGRGTVALAIVIPES
jgi:hypothetical protein